LGDAFRAPSLSCTYKSAKRAPETKSNGRKE
jgi:hypothetical protein